MTLNLPRVWALSTHVSQLTTVVTPGLSPEVQRRSSIRLAIDLVLEDGRFSLVRFVGCAFPYLRPLSSKLPFSSFALALFAG